ncbi:Protein FREE1, partial [Bienertia sinuspersici]
NLNPTRRFVNCSSWRVSVGSKETTSTISFFPATPSAFLSSTFHLFLPSFLLQFNTFPQIPIESHNYLQSIFQKIVFIISIFNQSNNSIMYQGMSSDTTNSFYHHHQFNQPPFQNPNPNPVVDPYINSWPSASASASAPPLSSSYAPTPDFPNYSPVYPPYPPNSDHVLNSTPTAPSFPPNPNPQFPPPSSNYSYDHNQTSYYNYDHNQAAPNPNLNQNLSFSGPQYSPPLSYDDGSMKLDRWSGYGEQEHGMYGSQGYSDEGVYRYEGGKMEPYGARGTAGFSGSNSQVMFDDYGRPINVSNGNDNGVRNGSDQGGMKAVPKVVKASPKVDMEEDVASGVQKFRVKVLAESYGQNDLDVLCEIGLDGIRMLDPATGRTLRIYPLDTITRWEVLDSYIFAFWAKMPVDIEPKRIRLKSNRYTTNTILDTVTAASVQVKEIGERKDSSLSKATAEQLAEKRKGFVDWMNLIKPPMRRKITGNCGEIFCDKCTQGRIPLTADEEAPPVRAEVTQRLADAKEAANRSGSLLSHGDLAKKLKVEVPASGSETIECSVCQRPFLVNAH